MIDLQINGRATPELRDVFLKRHPQYANIPQTFCDATGQTFDWENLTKPNLHDFTQLLKERVAPNTARTYCKWIKSILSLYNETEDIPAGWNTALTLRGDTSQAVYLCEDEIRSLMKLKLCEGTQKSIVRDLFVLGCLTGARQSDFRQFTKENIMNGRIIYVSEKTHREAEVPVSPAVLRILEGRRAVLLSTPITRAQFNRVLRILCQEAGIEKRMKLYNRGVTRICPKWKYVASHTARRSFATNLYLRGAGLYDIMSMMGHSDTEMTKRYICCGLRELPKEAMAYFNNYK